MIQYSTLTFQDYLDRLPDAHQTPSGQWRATCRSCGQKDALGLTERDDKVLVHCFGGPDSAQPGCPYHAIIEALGFSIRYPRRQASATGKASDFGREVACFELREADGEYIATHIKYVHVNGTKSFLWRRGSTWGLGGLKTRELPLYNLPALVAAPSNASVILCEGETPTTELASVMAPHGIVVVGTVCGAEVVPSSEVLQPLLGHAIYLSPDNDTTGHLHMDRIAALLRRM